MGVLLNFVSIFYLNLYSVIVRLVMIMFYSCLSSYPLSFLLSPIFDRTAFLPFPPAISPPKSSLFECLNHCNLLCFIVYRNSFKLYFLPFYLDFTSIGLQCISANCCSVTTSIPLIKSNNLSSDC